MLIRVLLMDKEEGLFNSNCLVAHLLDAIKKKHKLARTETIDLCTTEGHVKELNYHLNDCASEFFKLRELCLVVRVNESTAGHPNYTPVLPEYASNNQFVAVLNHRMATQMCVRVKLKNMPPVYKPRTPDPPAQNKARKRRPSRVKT